MIILILLFMLWIPVSAGAADAVPLPDPADALIPEFTTLMLALRAAMAKLDAQRLQLESDLNQIRARWAASLEHSPVTLASPPAPPPLVVKSVIPVAEVASQPAPLSIRLGSADFTPGGFLDFVGVFRSTNVGSGEATAFGTIPFSNTPQGRLGENRYSAQGSRISLKIASRHGQAALTGYVEADFLGAQPSNGLVSSNSNSLRLRQYFVDIRSQSWEVLGGQAWSLLTPNRTGISAMPSDLFLGTGADPNYLLGLIWTRAPQFRVVRHWNSNWSTGMSLESPDQFVGSAVVLPSGMYTSQLDNGGSVATPSLYPDIVGKAAFDGHVGRRTLHVEAAAVLRGFRVVNQANERITRSGGGGSLNLNFEAIRSLNLVVNTFYSSGGGRYISGLGPDLVLRPDGTPSLVRAASGIVGFEYRISPGWTLGAYQSGAYFQRNFALAPGGPIGYGYPGSGTAANRMLQESTISVVRTLWKRADLGALQVIGQYSRVWRQPWFVASAAPASAQTQMTFLDLRYTLP